MFWIGMIVGIVLMIAAIYGFYRYLSYTCGASAEDFAELGAIGMVAWSNRESTVQVWHDGDRLLETVFEENE